MTNTENAYFPTRIFKSTIGDIALLEALHEVCLDSAEHDTAGHDWSEAQGYAGYTSYASLDDLERRYPAIETLFANLDKAAAEAAAALEWDMSGLNLVRSGIWINILAEDGAHSGHIHPGNVLSGTVYVSMPEGAGGIRFEDPCLGLKMAAPPLIDTPSQPNKRFIYQTPQAGEALMWESWLRHEVVANSSEEFRISISFNYAVERQKQND